ncbi:acetyl/propionyl/methylcrotonyl-CoA carboxylase subunit alpha [Humitalea sp. 24SJ18S-53]|uniref:acetyl/propionyl/methylcrotonyl-CoA carboxylase subunit alpha n=1 Tax=Humitalea sp. 24SJ18S-53 TaxID=3422307 RepID=UPI003D666A1D
MIASLLIANRGEIACRIIRTARRMGIRSIAVFSDADRNALHVAMADEAVPIGASPARESYLRGDVILDAARRTGAQAIHPGYGFLSENADFAEACAAAGILFVGPPASAIRAMGSKAAAKTLAALAGAPILPGYHGEDQTDARLVDEAARIGFPLLIKATAGGGGRGMRGVTEAGEFVTALAAARRESAAAFGDDRVLLERWLQRPRHVEVQVFGDTQGRVVALSTRDCSIQRRHQKVLEEAPAPSLPPGMILRLEASAVAAAQAAGYINAGTVEFVVEGEEASFLEMNTRLQVEHPVTEMVLGLDLVEWQLRVAAGEPLPVSWPPAPQGHAIEVRLCAEDPTEDWRPSTGRLTRFAMPDAAVDLRIETGVREGDAVTPFYDSMIAKIVAYGPTRDAALARLHAALAEARVAGPATNLDFLRRLVAEPALAAADLDTGFIARHAEKLLPAPFTPPRALAAAIAARLPRAAGDDPWSRADGFRLHAPASLRMVVDRHPVSLTRAHGAAWTYAGAPLSARRLDDGALLVTWGDAMFRAFVEADRVLLDGVTHAFAFTDPTAPPPAAAAAGGRLSAPIPGRVAAINVGVGDTVTRGQVLAVIEAMKTELRITAPVDGTVTHIGCVAGDSVEEGTEIVTLEAATS